MKRKISAEWGKWAEKLSDLNQEGAVREYFEGNPLLHEAFRGDRTHVCCIDERVVFSPATTGKQFEAGSGILYPDTETVFQRAKAVAENLFRKGVEVVTSHAECGAAKMAFEMDAKAGQIVERKNFPTSDDYGQWFAEQVQEELNKLTGSPAKSIHIAQVNPQGFHNAIGSFFDVTGSFNPDFLGKDVPRMFVIDGSHRELVSSKDQANYALTQLRVSIGIALGNHGFGRQRFTGSEQRFIIPVVASSAEELADTQKLISQYLSESDAQLLDHVNISGFVRPAVHHLKHKQPSSEVTAGA